MNSDIKLNPITKHIITGFVDNNPHFSTNRTTEVSNHSYRKNEEIFYNRYLEIQWKDGKLELPCSAAIAMSAYFSFHPSLDVIYYPLYTKLLVSDNNNSTRIIKELLHIKQSNKLKQYVLKDNTVLYGATNFILDKDFNPLMYGVIELVKNTGILAFNRNILYLSKEIFRRENIITKNIVDKVLIDIYDWDEHCKKKYADNYVTNPNFIHIKIVDNIDVVKTPIAPTNLDTIQDDIKEIIRECV